MLFQPCGKVDTIVSCGILDAEHNFVLMSNGEKGNRRIQDGQLVGSRSSVVSSDVVSLRREVLVSTMQAGAGVTRDVEEPIDLCEALSLEDYLTRERKAEIVAMLSHKNVRPVFSGRDREIGHGGSSHCLAG